MEEEIYEMLLKMRKEGMTQQEIADTTGVSRPYICQLLNPKDGKERIKRLELSTFFKLFPDAKIVFSDEKKLGHVHDNTNSPIIQGDGNTIGTCPTAEETASAFLARIMAAADIDAETKVKIYNLLHAK